MTSPTEHSLLKWWEAKRQALTAAGVTTLTCEDCGRVDSPAYVQPQHPYYAEGREGVAWCTDCIARRNEEARRARRQALEAMPRCEVTRCARRGAATLRGVLLCMAHVRRAQRAHAADMAEAGSLALFLMPEYDRVDILRLAGQ